MVAKAAGIGKPLLQIDCGGRFVANLSSEENDSGEDGLAAQVASELGLDLLKPSLFQRVFHLGDTITRTLTGVNSGELVSVNGTVVARATGARVEIEARDGRIVGIRGADPKEHGLEKLHNIHSINNLHKLDLENAIIRSGSIRRSYARPSLGAAGSEGEGGCERTILIDHCAEDAFEAAQGASLAVTVGDDTTAIAGDILARLGIPVIGIVDGDLDRLAGRTTMLKGSVVIRVEPGYDDLVGLLVNDEIFQGEKRICINASDLAEKIIILAGSHVVHVERQ
jgi:hypothetical protein